MMNKKVIKFIVGGVVVLLTIAYLIYLGTGGAAPYYLTPSELKAKGVSVSGEEVRVGGSVGDDSVKWDSWNQKLEFKITDGRENFLVRFQGFIPESFKSESEVVVEGVYNPDGIFQARTVLVKCPSNYLPERAVKGLLDGLRLEEWLYW